MGKIANALSAQIKILKDSDDRQTRQIKEFIQEFEKTKKAL